MLTSKDSILVTDFVNTTGDSVFDGTLKTGLSVDLEQSPFLNVVPAAEIERTLKFMGQPQDARITSEIGREICQRDGIKAMITGSIASLGSDYVITLDAVNGATGDTLAETQVQAASENQVLNALGKATTALRSKLGESLASIKKFDTPLAHATTSSLEALKAFTLGEAAFDAGNELRALPFYQQAVQLDPNFALAYARLGTYYSNVGQEQLMAQFEQKAFDLRDRVSEHERLYITAHYYSDATGQIEKGIQAYELYKQTYPQDMIPWNNLAVSYGQLGEFNKALQNALEAIRLSPDTANGYWAASAAYRALGRFDEAKAVLNEALQHKLYAPDTYLQLAQVALADGDEAAYQRESALAAAAPDAKASVELRDASLAVSRGELTKASGLFKSAEDLAAQIGLKELEAAMQVEQATYEALFGEKQRAASDAHAALAVSSGPSVQIAAAWALAWLGEDAKAQALADGVAKSRPKDTFVQSVEVPEVEAVLAMNHGGAAKALNLLEAARPYDTARTDVLYTRAEAYLKANRASDAAQEFQKVVGLTSAYPADPLISLAQLGLARAYTLEGNKNQARTAYQNFLALWKNADPDIPLLQQAKAEYAKLQ